MTPATLIVHIDGKRTAPLVARALGDGAITVPLETFSHAVGAHMRPIDGTGAPAICRDDVCVPLETSDIVTWQGEDHVRLDAFAADMGIRWTVEADALHVTTVSGEPVRGLNIGDRPPDITLPDLNTGEPTSIGSFRGKKAIFYMWASW